MIDRQRQLSFQAPVSRYTFGMACSTKIRETMAEGRGPRWRLKLGLLHVHCARLQQ